MRRYCCSLALALLLPAAAASAETRTVRIPRVSSPPTLDEVLSASPPAMLAAITGFVQREPVDGAPSSQPTTAYLGYDDEHLYVLFVCKEDPSRVRANYTRRENIFGDDLVGIVLDTFRDQRRAYLFLTNPHGIQLDGVVSETQDDDYSFDTLWHSEGRVTEDGYAVRFAIPFRSLRFSSADVQTWGLALGRIIPRLNETSFWPYITRQVAGFGQQLAAMEGLRGISPGRNIQFIPYATFTGARFLEPGASLPSADARGRAGVDAKVVLHDAVTFDLTANPDFSQVESDEPQVTINQRFEVFFPEKRPFFIENSGYFTTAQQNLFFSRRVADPRLGARATGKAGGWAVAALAIDDRAPGDRLPGSHAGHGRNAGIFVGRLQRDLPGQSSIGGLVTSRDFLSSSNRVASADVRLRLSDNWFLSGQASASVATDMDEARMTGSAYDAGVSYNSRRLQYGVSYRDRSPGFRAELGFVPRVDMRQASQFGRYTWFVNRGPLVSYGAWLNGSVIWNHERVLQDWDVTPAFEIDLVGQTEVEIRRSESMERFAGVEFRRHATNIEFETGWLRWLTFGAEYRAGTGVNFFPAAGLSPFLAPLRGAAAGVTVRPSGQLRLETRYLYSHLARVFDNHIMRARGDYQFTREWSLRAIVDYVGVLPNESVVALARRKELKADLLLTYLVNPWTAVYVGYTDAYENLRLGPAGDLERFGGPAYSTGRQFFVKAGYLIRP